MPVFSSVVTDYWLPAVAADHEDPVAADHETPVAVGDPSPAVAIVTIDRSLGANRSVSLLLVDGGPAVLAVTPERAAALSLTHGSEVDLAWLRTSLDQAGVVLNEPDHVYYLPIDQQVALTAAAAGDGTRQLTDRDAAAFTRLAADAPVQEWEEAFVELDHWLVFGTFRDGRLVAAASMYPWGGTRLADLGVITLPDFRGRGLGRATVRASCAAAIELGYEPQYRCQLDNLASIALARAAGFAHFARWEAIVAG